MVVDYKLRGCDSDIIEGMFNQVSKSSRIGVYSVENDHCEHFLTLIYRGCEGKCDAFCANKEILERIADVHRLLPSRAVDLEVETIKS